eukprot:446035_1
MSTKDKTQQELQSALSELEDLKRNYKLLKRDHEALKQKGFEETIATKQKHSTLLQSELDDLKRKYQSLKRDHEACALKQKEFEQKTKQKHSAKFWQEIHGKCKKNDTQYMKSLIDNKTLSVNDVRDSNGWTLLHYAAYRGAYEIVQLCISLGADVTLKDKYGNTALDLADE